MGLPSDLWKNLEINSFVPTDGKQHPSGFTLEGSYPPLEIWEQKCSHIF